MPPPRPASWIAALALGLCPGAATAAEPTAEAQAPADPTFAKPSATRRSGFMVGTLAGVGISSMVGYPNDVKKAGYAGSYKASGVQGARYGAIWFGGALTDWFTFGVGVGAGSLLTVEEKGGSVGLIFHLEGFPLFPLGGRLRDLGVMLDAGTGVGTVGAHDDPTRKLVDSGSASFFGGGVFYEAFRARRVVGGPFVEGSYLWSDTLREPTIVGGLRLVVYTGP